MSASARISEPDASASAASAGMKLRVVYRDGAGEIHLDWPRERIAQAIADRQGTLWVDPRPQLRGHLSYRTPVVPRPGPQVDRARPPRPAPAWRGSSPCPISGAGRGPIARNHRAPRRPGGHDPEPGDRGPAPQNPGNDLPPEA